MPHLDEGRPAGAAYKLAKPRVSAAELAALYRGAELVALPSFYEGFGLPAIEALRAGAWDYLSKPVDRERLLTVLKAWLQR